MRSLLGPAANKTKSSEKMLCHFNEQLLIQLLPPVLISEIVLGVLANGLALWIFCFHLKPWTSSTVFLFNMTLADFLLIVALPFRASYYLSGMKWSFGDTFCNINLFMLALNRSGSIVFLTSVAVDRYVRVVHPHHPINSLSICKAVCCAAGLWALTISMTAHLLFIPRNITEYHCESFTVQGELTKGEANTKGFCLTWHRSVFVFSFWVPLVVILYCTFRIICHLRRRQLGQHARIKTALRFISAVVAVFIVCYLPSNIIKILTWIESERHVSGGCCILEDLNTAFYIAVTLTYLNNTLDPIFYYLSSPAFQNIFKRAFMLHPFRSEADSTKFVECSLRSKWVKTRQPEKQVSSPSEIYIIRSTEN